MALEALSTTELLNYIMHDSNLCISSTPFTCNTIDESSSSPTHGKDFAATPPPQQPVHHHQLQPQQQADSFVPGRKKRRRRPKICKNKEEAETQRMTHIAVERNRRKQMNEHLAVLRSLMPESYVQRGDQASIVGGAIEFVKELEHILQSLEAQKFTLISSSRRQHSDNLDTNDENHHQESSPFSQFFSYPQFSCSPNPLGQKYTSQSKAAVADIEVTLIETHANIRILSRRRVRQISKLVVSFHSMLLTILHLNVTTLDSLVLYSISAKVEDGCQLNSADDIAGAVHHMVRVIEEEAILGCQS